jgi:hypothetical protein
MKSGTKTAVQPVAPGPVAERVNRLRSLRERLTDHYLELAVRLHEEHDAQLWTKAPAPGGERYESEEDFWEEAVGVKRRTAYQLIAVGEVLAKVGEREEASRTLSGVGLHKLDVLVPILKKEPTMPTLRKWADLAKTHTREDLREKVGKSLGRPARAVEEPGERFRTYVINAMPDQDTKELAEEFFTVGARSAGSKNADRGAPGGPRDLEGAPAWRGPGGLSSLSLSATLKRGISLDSVATDLDPGRAGGKVMTLSARQCAPQGRTCAPLAPLAGRMRG